MSQESRYGAFINKCDYQQMTDKVSLKLSLHIIDLMKSIPVIERLMNNFYVDVDMKLVTSITGILYVKITSPYIGNMKLFGKVDDCIEIANLADAIKCTGYSIVNYCCHRKKLKNDKWLTTKSHMYYVW